MDEYGRQENVSVTLDNATTAAYSLVTQNLPLIQV